MPEYIILENGLLITPKITDFGLALPTKDRWSQQGLFIGTPVYMSPEQIRGDALQFDGRIDVWAIGVIFFELLTGRTPFLRSSNAQLTQEILNGSTPPIRQLRTDLNQAVAFFIERCLAKSSANRFDSMRSLLDASSELIKTDKTSSWSPKKFPKSLPRRRHVQRTPEMEELQHWWQNHTHGVCALIGGPFGVGKTTAAAAFVDEIEKENSAICIEFNFDQGVSPETALAHLLLRLDLSTKGSLTFEDVDGALRLREGSPVLVVLDAVDRHIVSGPEYSRLSVVEAKATLLERILENAVQNAYPTIRWLITCRYRPERITRASTNYRGSSGEVVEHSLLIGRSSTYFPIRFDKLSAESCLKALRSIMGSTANEEKLKSVMEIYDHHIGMLVLWGTLTKSGDEIDSGKTIQGAISVKRNFNSSLDERQIIEQSQIAAYAQLVEWHFENLEKTQRTAAIDLVYRFSIFRLAQTEKRLAEMLLGKNNVIRSGSTLSQLMRSELSETLSYLVELRLVEQAGDKVDVRYHVHPAVRDAAVARFRKKHGTQLVQLHAAFANSLSKINATIEVPQSRDTSQIWFPGKTTNISINKTLFWNQLTRKRIAIAQDFEDVDAVEEEIHHLLESKNLESAARRFLEFSKLLTRIDSDGQRELRLGEIIVSRVFSNLRALTKKQRDIATLSNDLRYRTLWEVARLYQLQGNHKKSAELGCNSLPFWKFRETAAENLNGSERFSSYVYRAGVPALTERVGSFPETRNVALTFSVDVLCMQGKFDEIDVRRSSQIISDFHFSHYVMRLAKTSTLKRFILHSQERLANPEMVRKMAKALREDQKTFDEKSTILQYIFRSQVAHQAALICDWQTAHGAIAFCLKLPVGASITHGNDRVETIQTRVELMPFLRRLVLHVSVFQASQLYEISQQLIEELIGLANRSSLGGSLQSSLIARASLSLLRGDAHSSRLDAERGLFGTIPGEYDDVSLNPTRSKETPVGARVFGDEYNIRNSNYLAATHSDCGLFWNQVDLKSIFIDADLLEIAIGMQSTKINMADRSAMPPRVLSLVARAESGLVGIIQMLRLIDSQRKNSRYEEWSEPLRDLEHFEKMHEKLQQGILPHISNYTAECILKTYGIRIDQSVDRN